MVRHHISFASRAAPRPADTMILLPALVGRFGTRLPLGDVSGRHINDVIKPACRAGHDAVAALPWYRWLAGVMR
jgi:hypothetical protein